MATILIIDDDCQIRGMLRDALESEGHTIFDSVNGTEGLEKYRACPTDLIICDLMLPEKSGLTMIRELVEEFPTLKFIIMSGLTGFGLATSLEFTKKFGAQWTLPKPFELAEMLTAVRGALGQTEFSPVSCI